MKISLLNPAGEKCKRKVPDHLLCLWLPCVLDASLGETLECEGTSKDMYTVAVKKSGMIVGRGQKNISN